MRGRKETTKNEGNGKRLLLLGNWELEHDCMKLAKWQAAWKKPVLGKMESAAPRPKALALTDIDEENKDKDNAEDEDDEDDEDDNK